MKKRLFYLFLLAYPLYFFGYYYFLMFLQEFIFKAFPLTILTFLLNGMLFCGLLGLYVGLMRLLSDKARRLIALFHTCVGIFVILFEIFWYYLPSEINLMILKWRIDSQYIYFYEWLIIFSGLAFALTYHGRIKPLCPMPKTRMAILLAMPLLVSFFYFIEKYLIQFLNRETFWLSYFLTYGPRFLHGMLFGFYVWMLERLNRLNHRFVLIAHAIFGIVVAGFIFVTYAINHPMVEIDFLSSLRGWSIFSLILYIFERKFTLNSQKHANINL